MIFGNTERRIEVEDIKLLEQCPKCGENLTLMSSIRVTTELSGSEWLVKRCLKCGGYPCTEVVMVKPAGVVYALPIDIGTIVYANTPTLVSLGKWESVTVGYEVGTVTIRSDNDPEYWAVGDDEGWAGEEIVFNKSDIGKKIFTTRAEAEEARKNLNT